MISSLAFTGALGLTALAFAATSADRERIARAMLWFSFFGPGFLAAQENVGGSTAVTRDAALRVAIPVGCIGIALLVSKPKRTGSTSFEVWLAVFMSVAFASSLWSGDSTATLLKVTAYSLQWSALLILVRSYDNFQSAVIALTHVVHLLMISVLAGIVLSPSAALGGGDSRQRLSGLYPHLHPNMIGILGVIALLSLVTTVEPPWMHRRTGLRALLACVYLFEMAAAHARAAIVIGLMVVVAALAREARRRLGASLMLLAAAIALLTSTAFISGTLIEFMRRGQNLDQFTSMSGRTYIWQAAMDLWREQPWQGFGYWVGHRHDLQPMLYNGATQSTLDNVWVEVLVDLGVIGVVAMAALVISGLTHVWLTSRGAEENMKTFVGACTVLLISASFFNPGLQTLSVPGIVLGLLLTAATPRLHPCAASPEFSVLSKESTFCRRNMRQRGARSSIASVPAYLGAHEKSKYQGECASRPPRSRC